MHVIRIKFTRCRIFFSLYFSVQVLAQLKTLAKKRPFSEKGALTISRSTNEIEKLQEVREAVKYDVTEFFR